MRQLFCSNCGQKAALNDRYCLSCGIRLTDSVSAGSKARKRILPIVIISGIAVLIIAAVLLVTVTGGGQYGNTSGNLANLGLATEKGDWIYYVSLSSLQQGSLNKIQKGGSNSVTLSGTLGNIPMYVNVIDDWIYYSFPNGGIYKIHTEGGESTLLEKNGWNISVVNNWIYYLDLSCNEVLGELYKMKTDGSEREKLTADNTVYWFSIAGNWIYYAVKVNNQGTIYKCKTDGSDQTLLLEGVPFDDYDWIGLMVDGDWIYYTVKDKGKNILYMLSTDGRSNLPLLDEGIKFFNVAEGWIYYTKDLDNPGLYKVRLDGSENTQLWNGSGIYYANIVGEWVYFDLWDNSRFASYRIRTDGSGMEIAD